MDKELTEEKKEKIQSKYHNGLIAEPGDVVTCVVNGVYTITDYLKPCIVTEIIDDHNINVISPNYSRSIYDVRTENFVRADRIAVEIDLRNKYNQEELDTSDVRRLDRLFSEKPIELESVSFMVNDEMVKEKAKKYGLEEFNV